MGRLISLPPRAPPSWPQSVRDRLQPLRGLGPFAVSRPKRLDRPALSGKGPALSARGSARPAARAAR